MMPTATSNTDDDSDEDSDTLHPPLDSDNDSDTLRPPVNVVKEVNPTTTAVDGASKAGGDDAADNELSDVQKRQQWAANYGALILFFEAKGHTYVPNNHPNVKLRQWVEEQRENYSKLSPQQVAQLAILHFRFSGRPYKPYEDVRCPYKGCKRFAAFNGFCHAHRKAADDKDAAENKNNDATLSDAQKQQQWAACYGSLILFFEAEGHTNVHPGDHANAKLRKWVAEQRENYSKLTPQQVAQLAILNFPFKGKPHKPVVVVRCRCRGCEYFAAFNGLCHTHYSEQQATTTSKTKPTNIEAKKRNAASISAPDDEDTGTSKANRLDNNKATKEPKPKKPKIKVPPPPKPEFPLVGLFSRKNGTFDVNTQNGKIKELSRQELIERINTFVQKLAGSVCIRNADYHRKPTLCNCMKFLEDKPFVVEAVSNAILDYALMPTLQRKHYAVSQMRYAEIGQRDDHSSKDGPQRIFTLPLSYDFFEQHNLNSTTEKDDGDGDEEREGDSEEEKPDRQKLIGDAFKHRICRHAFCQLHNIGQKQKQSLSMYVNGHTEVTQHGLAGKKWSGNKKYEEAYESLTQTLDMLVEEHRHLESKKGIITLPLQISKRNVFEQWQRSRGWDIRKGNKETGQYENIEDWDLMPGFYRTEEEAMVDGGDIENVAKFKVSWSLFNKHWVNKYPNLKTQGRVGKGMFGGKYDFEKQKYYT